MKKYIFILFHVFAFSQNNWWTNPPNSDQNKYIGIGSASTANDDYSLLAEKQALRSIALEINSQISGQTRRRVITTNEISEREFENEFIVSTLANFKGLRKIDDHIDEKNKRYYIYYEYNKSDHRKNIADTKKQCISLIDEYEAINDQLIVSRLQKLVYTYELLFQLYGEDVFANVKGRNVNLQTFVPSEVQNIIRLVNFRDTYPGLYQAVYMEPLVTPLQFDAFYQPPGLGEEFIDNLPFDFQFEGGSGNFAFKGVSAAEGIVYNEISKITSKIPVQFAISFIDLKALKRSSTEFFHLDQSLDRLSMINKINFKIKVSLVSQDHIFFGVSFSEGIPNPMAEPIREAFEVSFNNKSNFKIVDRLIVKAILSELGINEQDLCTKSECDVQVGRKLGVNRMIKINMNYNSQDQMLETIFTDTDVKSRLVQRKEPYRTEVKDGNIESAIFDNIDDWVFDFYEKLNPPTINLKSNVAGLKVSYKRIKSPSDLPGITYSDRSEYQFLPLIDFEVDPGTYQFVFEKDGFETKKRTVTLNANSICCDDVNLVKKTPLKAFYRSLLAPGLGQRYGTDSRNQNTGQKSLLHASIGAFSTIAMVYTWYAFSSNQKSYNDAQISYARSTTVAGIESTRSEAVVANNNLNQSYNTALAMTAIMAGFSIYSGVDAAITLPKY